MAKKRNCERTDEERKIHERAVAFRKMTDKKLVEFFESMYEKGFEDGKQMVLQDTVGCEKEQILDQFLKKIADIKGIGTTTLLKIQSVFGKMGTRNGEKVN